MAPVYETIAGELGVAVDAALLASLREANAKRLEELEDKIKDAGGCWWVGGWVGAALLPNQPSALYLLADLLLLLPPLLSLSSALGLSPHPLPVV